MIALLNTQNGVLNGYAREVERSRINNLDKIFRLSFEYPIRLDTIISFIETQDDIRFATNMEIFSMLSLKSPIQNGEVIVCLERDVGVGDNLLIIREDGPAIVSAIPIWDTRYSFPVVSI